MESGRRRYRGRLPRRARGGAVAYLVGHKEFMALDFEVTPAVLVPNPDTEVLVQRAVAIAREAGPPPPAADGRPRRRGIPAALRPYAPPLQACGAGGRCGGLGGG